MNDNERKPFALDPNGVDPGNVPCRRLPGGDRIPAIGLGTFGSDHIPPQAMADAVHGAIAAGYRHIDCASVYGNEREIGGVLKEVLDSGLVKREELWITSKVWNDSHARVRESCRQTLSDLRLDYLDLYLVHWPFPNHHAAGVSVDSRDPHAKPYIHADFMKTWERMEALVDAGAVRHIGVSNMTVPKLKLLLRDCRIRPACNEMELHPHFQQPELFDFVVGEGIVPIGYSPIGSPARPERDRAPGDTVDIEDPAVIAIAQSHNAHPATVCVKWAQQRGQIPIPLSTTPRNYIGNIRAVTEDPLTPDEMETLGGVDRNSRLIKGQVFLWEGAAGWEDLWDMDGTIKD